MRGNVSVAHGIAKANICSVRTGTWVGDCFIYTNSTNRLNYLVGDQTYTISHFDAPHYLLGYLPRDSRIYVADKDVNVVSFALSLAVVEYQTLVLRGDLDAAEEVLPSVPKDQNNKIARFLEGQGYKELALKTATDPEHRFDLALSLGDLQQAVGIAREQDTEHKWKTVGDAALTAWDVSLAKECFVKAKDLGSLLLVYSATADASGLRELATLAGNTSANNIAFSALWQVGDVQACIDLLVKTNRLAEAVLFSQTYKPSQTNGLVKQWKASLDKENRGKVGRLLGVPPQDGEGDEEMFPEWEEYLRLEREGGTVEDLLLQEEDAEPDAEAEAVEEEIAEEAEAEAEAEDDEEEEDEE
jgi:coatomer subunit beta'